MIHVNAIRKFVDEGEYEQAHSAIENLLALGPNNLEALKLQAKMYEVKHELDLEMKTWSRVLDIDQEDPDAINFLIQQQTEDREHFYFSDELPGGGRRYLCYPKSFIYISLLGLMGCICFFGLRTLSDRYPLLSDERVLLGSFAFFVLTPWLGIIYTWIRSLKSVIVHTDGLKLETRFGTKSYQWKDYEQVLLTYRMDADYPNTSLVLVPKDLDSKALKINLTSGVTPIKARTYLIRDVGQRYVGFRKVDENSTDFSKYNIKNY